MKDFLKNIFVSNWQYKILAIVTSCGLWFYVASGQTLTVNISVPVVIENFPSNMKITNRMETAVDLQLGGRRDFINNFARNKVSVSINMIKASEGKNTYTIDNRNIKGLVKGVEVISISPGRIEVILEKTYGEKAGDGNGKTLR